MGDYYFLENFLRRGEVRGQLRSRHPRAAGGWQSGANVVSVERVMITSVSSATSRSLDRPELQMKIEAAHIQRWMSAHESSQLEASVSAEFERYLDSQPWGPSRLDWNSITHVVFTMASSWESELVEFTNQTPVSRHSHLVLMYNGAEPSLLSLREDGLRDLDLIYSASPGARYFCGGDIVDGRPVPCYEDFAEFDGNSKVTFRL